MSDSAKKLILEKTSLLTVAAKFPMRKRGDESEAPTSRNLARKCVGSS